jgi:hypothetical protein
MKKALQWLFLSVVASLLILFSSHSRVNRSQSGSGCYISESGAGERSGLSFSHAYAWSNGEGLERCLADVHPGETIYLQYSDDYHLTEPIQWHKSGTADQFITLRGAGEPAAGGAFGRSVLQARDRWSTITGTRSTTDGGEGGNNFLQFDPGVSYVKIQNLNLHRFDTVFLAGNSEESFRNHHIVLSDLSVDYAREVIGIHGKDDNAEAEFWQVSRIYALGVSKRMVRAEGLQNSVFSDLYVDTKSPEGKIFWDDWPLLFHFDGPSQAIQVIRSIAKNPGQRDDTYDNGDCFTTESDTSNIEFESVQCFDAFDAAFDLKGTDHRIHHAIAFRIGNRAFRVWHGPVTITNAIAGFDGQGDYTQDAQGSNAAIWAQGEVTVEHFTSINNTRPYLLEGGQINISKSIIALDRHHADQSVDAESESEGTVEETDTVVRWIEGQTGRDPKFSNAANAQWDGEGADFDSRYYRDRLGFQNNG